MSMMRGRMQGVWLAALIVLLCHSIAKAGKEAAAAVCIASERDALLAFKAGICADSAGELPSWQGHDCCSWGSVSCSKRTGHVIGLDLGQYALSFTGEINSSLVALTHLRYLNLSGNNFGGVAIPDFIGSFSKLRYLDLSHAGFAGLVPPQLGNLSMLRHLALTSSTIRMDNFHWVSRLRALRYLDLGWLYLVACSDWLQSISGLPLLQVLRLHDAFLPATSLNSVSYVNFTALTVLDLSNNELNSTLPSWIWSLRSLSYLDLSSCQLSGSVPDKIGNLSSLTFLRLLDNHLEGEIPQTMSRLCSLNIIDMSRNNLSGNIAVEKNLFYCMKELQVLNVGFNNLTGNLSGWLEHLKSLTTLDLSKNSFTGQIPEDIGKLSQLIYLDLSYNAFMGRLSEVHLGNLSRLDFLSLASNKLKMVIEPNWMPTFQLTGLGLHGCHVGPHIPAWLRSQSRIEMIDLGSTKIEGTLPDWLWNFSSSITTLDISSNSITGHLPTSLVHMKMLSTFNMRSNVLEGGIPGLPASVKVLDLSKNFLSGSLPQSLGAKYAYYIKLSDNQLNGTIPAYLCEMDSMELVDLSNNLFSGVLPDCWKKSSRLHTIDFSNNNLHGEIPSTMGFITSLAILSLRENSLSGTLPSSLQSCNGLIILDLGSNSLSGSLPSWLGDSLGSLITLSLRSNQFSGEIPESLPQLHALQNLDLASNKLSGPVPQFLGNLTSMCVDHGYAVMIPSAKFATVYTDGRTYLAIHVYTDKLESYSSTYDFLLNFIDLSRNQFTGEIPREIGAISFLLALNLSGNHILGSIPDEIGNLSHLEALDLSSNELSGSIPPSITDLINLSVLNLSYNDLSGVIPCSSQFSTFTDEPYLGNADLCGNCGASLSRICSQHTTTRKHQNRIDRGTYLCTLLGFAYGLSVVSAILIFSKTARKAYFQFTDKTLDDFRAMVQIKLNRIKAGRRQSMEIYRLGSQNSITCYELEFGSTTEALIVLLCHSIAKAGKEAAAAVCIASERDALLAFKAGICADSAGELPSWQGHDCCSWGSVSCSKRTGHVIGLDLGQYALSFTGEINSSLVALTHLRYLNLSGNNFGGVAIPDFIGSFSKLRYLDLSHAGFAGLVPPQLGNLSMLRHLALTSSTIRMDNFHWVSRLRALRYLDLGWLYLVACSDWLQSISGLPLLQVLRLHDAFLPATSLNSVSYVNFTALTVLDLSNNELNSTLPSWIWSLRSLSYLDLSSCQLSGSVPDKIGNLSSLTFLRLLDNHLEGEIPQTMSRLCSLNIIDMSRNNLSGNIAVEKNLFYCMKELQVLNVGFNNLTGNLSGWLEHLKSLTTLDLSKNSFTGQIPEDIGKLSQLIYLDLSYNAFMGRLSEVHLGNLSRLDFLSLASNKLKMVIEPNWMPTFQLTGLGLHGCHVGPHIPAWLRSQSRIEMIDLGSTKIEGTLPDWLWNFSSSITTLDISSNSITGHLPTSLVHMKMLSTFNMRSNVLEGGIPGLPASVKVLDLSKNFLSGSLPQSLGAKYAYYIKLSDNQLNGTIPAYLCEMDSMELVDLSNNLFSGVLPDCWKKSSRLHTIDFSNNNLHGEIPSTMGFITSLAILSLRENSLSGTLPSSLQSCNGLIILDLGSNSLSGSLPSWLGDSLGSLITLSLRSNQFSGEIPESLPQLHALQNLDLASNKLSGPVPQFLGNLTSMCVDHGYAVMIPSAKFATVYTDGRTYLAIHVYTDKLESYSSTYDFLLNFIDLSRNQFTGEIPREIGAISFLLALNLSGNHILGSIPDEIGNLSHLEALDLSSNELSGSIPPSITDLINLSVLNLSYNDLSGVIPCSSQFSTFTDEPYLGNADLCGNCGASLSRICSQHTTTRKHQNRIDRGTYLCTLLGFAYGLSVVSAILIFSKTARKAYFQFTDKTLDDFRAMVQIKLNRIKAGRRQSMEIYRLGSQNSITCYELEFGSTTEGN
uniref:non-specific serine/threonine protein kinase n=1 Tax=Oryza barthii TaxID=65489 RepID=A0A0D3GCK7_9ORYZ